MTPKEKAKELVNKYLRTYPIYDNPTVVISYTNNEAKQCTLIAVDEVLFVLNEIDSTEQWNASWFYNQVKQEIEKL
jgi:hypothetical protein